jgi:hypothetical protein
MSDIIEVVRQFGVNKTHVASIPDGLRYNIAIFGKDGVAVEAPIVAFCRTELKRDPIVVMTKAKVRCQPCKRLSGVGSVGDS